jgi:hypothetical protein
VVVLTDGRDENNPGNAPGSEHTFAEVVNLMRTVGAAIYPIGLGPKVDRTLLEHSLQSRVARRDSQPMHRRFRRSTAALWRICADATC